MSECRDAGDDDYDNNFRFYKCYAPHILYDVRFIMCRLAMERMHRVLEAANGGGIESRTFPRRNSNVPKTLSFKQ